jgi:hypothetical protein
MYRQIPLICLVFRHFVSFYLNFIKPDPKKQPTFTQRMKKLLVSIIAVLYLGTSIGATVNLHYCMGRLVNWDFSHKEHRTCGKCGMEKATKSGCCEDKYKVLQVEKDHKAGSTYQSMQPPAIEHTAIYPSFSSVVITTLSEEQPVSKGPPRSLVPVHIRLCVFRI